MATAIGTTVGLDMMATLAVASADAKSAVARGEWMSGRAMPVTPKAVRPNVGRNDPCPCASGKKYKVCCRRSRA